MWLPPIARIYIPLISMHLVLIVVELIGLGIALAQESKYAHLHSTPKGKILDLSNVNARRTWFKHWTFTVAWLMFHVILDIYTLICETDFYNVSDESDLRIPQAFLFFYVLSLSFRTDDHVLTVPGLADIAMYYHAQEIRNTLDESVSSYLLWSTSSLSSSASVLFNAAMYFGFSDSCQDMFACVYTWDHWYMTMSCLSLLWYLFFTVQIEARAWTHWMAAAFLLPLVIWTASAPILFHHNIMRITFICNVYYQAILAGVSLFLLHKHYSPDS